MGSETVRRRLIVHGRVQGVFFRDSIRESARNEGVAGWASNLDDGAVEVVLEGPETAVKAVAEYCRLGPVRARVARVEESEEAAEGLTRFEIR
jgi:acylphosphatase